MLGKDPERQREIEFVQSIIRNCARAGIPAVKYNMSLLGVLRTADTPGRAARASTWRLAEAREEPPLTGAGKVSCRRRLGAHHVLPRAHRPGRQRTQGPARLPSPRSGRAAAGLPWHRPRAGHPRGAEALRRDRASPYHGLNLCLGTTAEMLQDPRREIHDIIREFGRSKKIFNIHFRNIRAAATTSRRSTPTKATWTCSR